MTSLKTGLPEDLRAQSPLPVYTAVNRHPPSEIPARYAEFPQASITKSLFPLPCPPFFPSFPQYGTPRHSISETPSWRRKLRLDFKIKRQVANVLNEINKLQWQQE
jgi:hypothetical protein